MEQIGFGMGDPDTISAIPQFQEYLLDDVLRCILIFGIQIDKTKQGVVIGIIQPVKHIYVNMGTHNFSSINNGLPAYRKTDIPEVLILTTYCYVLVVYGVIYRCYPIDQIQHLHY